MKSEPYLLILDFKVALPDFPEHEIIEFAGILCNKELELIECEAFKIQNNNKVGINFFDAHPKILSLMEKSDIIVFHDIKQIIHRILINKFSTHYRMRGSVNTAKHLPLDLFEKKNTILDLCLKYDLHYLPGKSCLDETFRIRNLIKHFGVQTTLQRSFSKFITIILEDLPRTDGIEISKKIGFEFREGFYRRRILECDLAIFEEYCKKINLTFKIL